ncbi:MAG: VWA domain-containing protein [Betaproteobacteria bacterium]|nr:VWA domain-containing protein [Betaproteobacteria bacterium]MCC6249769.1 VWA domain-containing protein [Rubrivivax sp.]
MNAAIDATINATPGPPAAAYERPYDQLATLPRAVWLPALVSAVGTRGERLAHTRAWVDALVAGQLPDAAQHFGAADASAPLRAIVGDLGLPALAHGVPTLAEQVLRTLLWHLDRLVDLQPKRTRAEAIAQITAEFRETWRIDTAGLEDELALLRELADGARLQWDQLAGQLRSREWQQVRRAAGRLERLPELVDLLDRVGRRELHTLASPRPAPAAGDAPRRRPLKAVQTRIAGAPGELTGIRFAASIERMLAAEAVLRSHPVGRRLWRARHAEGRLLAHDTEAVLTDWRADPDAPARAERDAPPPESLARGPIVLCLDTSGSMRGAPEHIAKAIVVAALKAARAGGRGCRLVAFGGPGELLERDLAAPGGLAAVLELMGQSFDGGTDIQTPIERAVELLHDHAWHGADVLVVSDGEFGCVPATLARLDEARATLGTAVFGVLVGDRETMGMLEICDEIHWVRDWRRHLDGDDTDAGAPRLETLHARPVHSKSLTALYFPNALSPRAAQRHGGPQR